MIQFKNMKCKGSSSSSGSSNSVKLIPCQEFQITIEKYKPSKDLFDMLIDQEEPLTQRNYILRTISSLNLSPRQLAHQGCKCTKIDCLKMYCECFSKGRLCNEKCFCNCCSNKMGFQMEIYKAQQMANFRHPGTFKDIPAFVPLRRCTCKKSSCRKNYCDCFRAGQKCTEQCQCLDCHNGKPHHHEDYFDSRMQIEVSA